MSASSGHTELERLVNASIDGELSDADEASLQGLLRDDETARQRYLQFTQLHAELHWDHGAAAALLVSPEGHSVDQRAFEERGAQRIGGWKLPAIVMGTLAAGWLLAFAFWKLDERTASAAPAVASVEMTQGTVSFRVDRGESLELRGRGQALPAGTLLLEGESSAVQWRFLDGTLITVSGDAEVEFSNADQKLLRVRQGLLTAEVEPQPAGAPLIVETSTARIEVLGTVFTLAAESDRTRINVAEGRVRLERLVDGETVEVSGEHSCVASLDARGNLQPMIPDQPSIGWQHRFSEPPPERWKGEWLPAEGGLPPRVRAVPCLVGHKQQPGYVPLVRYGVTARRVDETSLGTLPDNGRLRIRYRTARPARLNVFLGLNRADGRFGGNFEVVRPRDAEAAGPDDWRESTISLQELTPLTSRYPRVPEDARPYLILITTDEDDAGLEVSELAIETTPISGTK